MTDRQTGVQTIIAPSGDQLVVLAKADYEDLLDARDHAEAMAAARVAPSSLLDDSDMDAYLAAATPLAFWRRRSGRSQGVVARRAGISQAFLAQMETGKRTGDVATYARLAEALGHRIEDLIPDKMPAPGAAGPPVASPAGSQ